MTLRYSDHDREQIEAFLDTLPESSAASLRNAWAEMGDEKFHRALAAALDLAALR